MVMKSRTLNIIRKMSKVQPNPAKTALRAEIDEQISALSEEEKKRQSEVVFQKLVNHPWYTNAERISLFLSTDREINTFPILDHIRSRGAHAFAPQYAGGRMRMLRMDTDDEKDMPETKHGIKQHSKEVVREDAMLTGGLDLIIAPGVAFARSGDRLGHGGGYYDRYMKLARANPNAAPKVVAVAFDCQIVESVPMDEHDQKVDLVLFPSSTIIYVLVSCRNLSRKYCEIFKILLTKMTTPNPEKAVLRLEIDNRLAALTEEVKKRQSEIVFQKLINHSVYQKAKRISVFLSTATEIDTRPIIDHIRDRGASAFVPQYIGGRRMRMLKMEKGDEDLMPYTRHGIQQHPRDLVREDALERGLDLIIAPGAAFTRAGDRLGHGGRYYDNFIASTRGNPDTAPKIIAVTFNCQVVDYVPMEEHDQAVDEVLFAE
ncbi:uncharacterized protein Mthfs [Plodia interpunctella]|uniref:uncharacterized protein Mthfs n=1 Tax=Plodia interpunctella TaxID=58824 RepID=UPI002367AA79|nr:uncharacterized protein LOC128677893 [Plodia interpunctella]